MKYPTVEYRGKEYIVTREDKEWFYVQGGFKVRKDDPGVLIKHYGIPKGNINFEDIEHLEDIINKPVHYHKGGIDVIGFAEQKFSKEELRGFYRINAIKYITRYEMKGGLDDLDKAIFYVNKLKELEGAV